MRNLRRSGVIALALGLVALIVTWRIGTQHWLSVHTGSENTSGTPPNYNFWSGFGSVFPWSAGVLVGWVAFVTVWWHKHNCHNEKCWRIGVHQLHDGQYVVCRKHHNLITGHPHRKLSTEYLRARHQEHLARQNAPKG